MRPIFAARSSGTAIARELVSRIDAPLPEKTLMKTSTTAFVAIVALATSALACSSSSGSGDEVDTATALASLRTPTGSFSEATAGKALGGYRARRADSARVSTPGATVGGESAGTKTASIRLLDKAKVSCGGGQSCACPNGGSLSYTAESNADGAAIKVSFDACGFEDGWGFDGKAVLLASKKSLLGTPAAPATPAIPAAADGTSASSDTTGTGAAGTSFGNEYVSILVAAKGVASNGGNRLELEFALVAEAHYAFLAVQVADGKVVIGVSDDGRAIVKSKEGTWTCTTTSSSWTCTSDTGKSMTVTEDSVTP
jgi:hypothetical protein